MVLGCYIYNIAAENTGFEPVEALRPKNLANSHHRPLGQFSIILLYYNIGNSHFYNENKKYYTNQ